MVRLEHLYLETLGAYGKRTMGSVAVVAAAEDSCSASFISARDRFPIVCCRDESLIQDE